ncbi:MAG TPA: tetratricopeptide repeat protein [Longimicrobiaceae bacterium]|nr:tetratricopeptide repeat protein [Longimicrobiaceae bacterium]
MRRAVLGVGLLALVLLLALAARRHREAVAAPAPAPRADSARVRERLFWERYREATRARTSGRLPEAVAAYTAALALDSTHEDALYYLGNVELELGRYTEAERAWSRLVEVNPRSDRGYGRLGELYLCTPDETWRDLPRAEALFQRALHVNREQTGPLLRLGEVALLRGDGAAAARYFSAVLGSNAESATASYFAGYLAWEAGDMTAAAAHFRRATTLPAASAGPGEGDTKSGPPRAALQDPACRVVQQVLDSAGGSAARPAMGASYGRLRAILSAVTPAGPPPAPPRRAGRT